MQRTNRILLEETLERIKRIEYDQLAQPAGTAQAPAAASPAPLPGGTSHPPVIDRVPGEQTLR